MIGLIEEIIDRFGGRLAGSKAERDAQLFLQKKLEALGADTQIHTFLAPLKAKPYALKLNIFGYWVSLIVTSQHVAAGLILAALNTILFTASFVLFSDIMDGLFPKKESLNLTASLEPQGEVKQTIIVAGHIDSTLEYIWWYWFKNFGMVLTLISGFSVLLFPLAIAIGFMLNPSNPPVSGILLVFAILSPTTLTMFFMRNNTVVPGAQDNLSAITVAFHILERLAHPDKEGKSELQHTRLKMVSFGSEETGLKGSKAYAKAHEVELKAENALIINMDGIMNVNEFSILKGELMTRIEYDSSIRSDLQAAFDAQGVEYRTGKLTVGATDGAPFVKVGIPAATILALPIGRLDPTYHTRLDRPEFIDPKALQICRDAVIDLIRKRDESAYSF
ncbi:MAG: M28 family peptidase [Bacteroidota bacterium]